MDTDERGWGMLTMKAQRHEQTTNTRSGQESIDPPCSLLLFFACLVILVPWWSASGSARGAREDESDAEAAEGAEAAHKKNR